MSNIELAEGDAFGSLRELPEDYGSAAVVDYPWQFDTDNNTNRFSQGDASDGESAIYYMEPHSRVSELCELLTHAVEPGGWCFFFGDDEIYPELRSIVEGCEGLTRRQTVFWDRVHFGMGYYHRVQVYPIVAATVGDTERYVQGRGTLYEAEMHGSSADYHTEKPAELYEQLLAEPVLQEGERVLEPFAGTAPGARAADALGMDAWSCEQSDGARVLAREKLREEREEREEAAAQVGVTDF